jgi:NAD-dependent SIR2 family protein deacetylase
MSIKEKCTNNKSFRKKSGIYFLLFLFNKKFKISDLISIDYFENNNNKKVAKTWRDIKKSRKFKYKI